MSFKQNTKSITTYFWNFCSFYPASLLYCPIVANIKTRKKDYDDYVAADFGNECQFKLASLTFISNSILFCVIVRL